MSEAPKPKSEESQSRWVVALAGNPNSGKTTLFNSLTGLRQKVANYPGVTVEKKEGACKVEGKDISLIDLPGLYSLDAASPDEKIARDVLTGSVSGTSLPDCVVAVVDATNLERHLYLVTQVAEFGIPVVIALTMTDLADREGIVLDASALSDSLKMPVIPIRAISGEGLGELGAAVAKACEEKRSPQVLWGSDDTSGIHDTFSVAADVRSQIFARYKFISDVFQRGVRGVKIPERATTAKLDAVLTHRFFGPIILIAILLLVFQSIFSWANLPMDLLEKGFGALADLVRARLPEGIFADLIADGIIAGVGGVMVFLPQILLLFLFISLLEDTGYMARAAFMLDRLMTRFGLHGKAFLPLISSFACAIPGILSTRTIESSRDRLITIMVAPLMSCSARLPVYTLMIATFFSGDKVFGFVSVGALMMLAMYGLGILVAIIASLVLKKTALRSANVPFVMELPPYRLPNIRGVFQQMLNRASQFVQNAGTVILAISIVLWALTYFPRHDETHFDAAQHTVAIKGTAPDAALEAHRLEDSYAGRIGRAVEPVLEPLGFDWKIGVGLIASFAAREVFVSTMSIIYNVGGDSDAESPTLVEAVKAAKKPDGSPAWTPLTAVTLMVFFVLAMQCMSTIAVVYRETASLGWTVFLVVYMTGLAYGAAFATFQIGRFMGY
ncbi:MAG: ferrous iron transport protein B [Acidobacteriota bacterium]